MNLSINKGTPTAPSTKDWKDGTQCQKCKTAFSWTTRKHHCRSCGGVFCGRCSSHTKVIPKWGSQPVRVCDDCFSEPQKVTSSPPDPDQFPYGQSPPVELNLSSSMPRTFFESWVGEEPTARWVSNPNPYGTSPTSTLSSTPPEFFLDPDMEVKTAEELEKDRQKELKELEQRRVRKEEKKRRKAIEKLIAEEKKKEAAKASSVGGEAKDKEAEGEATPKENSPGLTINVQKSAAIGAEGTSRTPPSENDVALVHLDNNTNSPLNTSMLLQHPPSPVTSSEPRRLGHPEENAAEAEKDVPPSNTTTPQATPTPSRATKATPAEGERRRTSGRKGRNGSNENNNSIKRKKRAAQKLENNTISAKLKELASALLSGLFDSLKLKYAVLSLSRSSTAFYRARDVLILSVLLLGSYLVFLNVLIPHIDEMLNLKQHTNAAILVIVYTVDFVLKAIFWLLWLGPLYGLSIVLYAHWYEGIAYGSFGLHVFWKKGVKMNADSRGLATVIGEAVYRSLIFGAFIGIGWLCGWVPYVGSLLYFLNICWTYSVYCFEYKWNNQSWGLNRKLEYFETRWIYFAGFGLPFALTSFWLDYVTGYCLLALLFPVFIPVAMYGNPSRQKAWQPIPLSRFLDNSIFTPVILFVKSKFRTG